MGSPDNDVQPATPAPAHAPSRRGLLAGAAAAVAAPTLLTGCGTAGAGDGPMQFWNTYAPQKSANPAVRAQARWFEDLVAAWNDTHRRKIELVFVPGSEYNGGSKLPASFAAGQGPDIFLVSPGDFLRYYNGGVLADLTPHMDPEVIADYGPVLDSRMVDGRVYALPMEVEPLAIYYAVDAFEQAGLSEGDIPTTWDELLDVGDRLRTRTRAGLVFDPRPGYYQNFTWYPFLWQGGGEVIGPDGRSAFDSRAARQALQLWQDAVAHGITPRTIPAAGDFVSAMSSGLAAMWQSGIWELASLREFAPDFRFGVFRLPVPPGGEYTTDLGGWAFCANAQGRDPEAAAEFCAWALGSMTEECIDRMAAWCTEAKTDIAPRESVLRRATERGGYDWWAMRTFRDEIAPGGRPEPRYPPVVYKSVSDAVQATMLAGADPAGEAERAGQAIDAYLKSYEGASLV